MKRNVEGPEVVTSKRVDTSNAWKHQSKDHLHMGMGMNVHGENIL